MQCVQLFLNLLSKVRKDESLQMILTVLTDITEVRLGTLYGIIILMIRSGQKEERVGEKEERVGEKRGRVGEKGERVGEKEERVGGESRESGGERGESGGERGESGGRIIITLSCFYAGTTCISLYRMKTPLNSW